MVAKFTTILDVVYNNLYCRRQIINIITKIIKSKDLMLRL